MWTFCGQDADKVRKKYGSHRRDTPMILMRTLCECISDRLTKPRSDAVWDRSARYERNRKAIRTYYPDGLTECSQSTHNAIEEYLRNSPPTNARSVTDITPGTLLVTETDANPQGERLFKPQPGPCRVLRKHESPRWWHCSMLCIVMAVTVPRDPTSY